MKVASLPTPITPSATLPSAGVSNKVSLAYWVVDIMLTVVQGKKFLWGDSPMPGEAGFDDLGPIAVFSHSSSACETTESKHPGAASALELKTSSAWVGLHS